MRRTLAPLGLYGALSLLFYGHGVLGHLGSHLLAADDVDSSAFTWFYAWWPHALLHGLNPFVTHLMFAPDGYNLTWSTSMPLPSVLLAPLTLTAGPVATYNVIQLLAPALTAFTMFLLCRHVTGRIGPALAGGFAFGFSPYVSTHMTGGPYLALAFLLPLGVLLVVKRLDGSLSPRRFALWLWLVLVVQAGISVEVLATATVFGALALLLAYGLLPERRAALRGMLRSAAAAYGLTAVVLSPFLYYFVFGPNYAPTATGFSADALAPVVPPSIVELATRHGGLAHTPAGSNAEAYVGLPVILLLGIYAWMRRRERLTWVLLGTVAAAYVAALGKHLLIGGHATGIPLPWLALSHLPVLRYAIPLRLVVFALLPALVAVALLLARGGGRAAWALAALGALAILPHFGDAVWHSDATDPSFFSAGQYRAHLHRSERVLTIPAIGRNERWQADTGFGFTLAAGYAGTAFPAGYTRYPIWRTLAFGVPVPDAARELRRFLAAKRVDAIVLDPTVQGPWRALFATLPVRPQALGGILLYQLRSPAAR